MAPLSQETIARLQTYNYSPLIFKTEREATLMLQYLDKYRDLGATLNNTVQQVQLRQQQQFQLRQQKRLNSMVAQKDGKKRKKNAAEVIAPVLPQYINKLYGVSQPGSSANSVPAFVPPINNNVNKIGNGAPINNNVSNTGNNAPINNNVSKIGNGAPINNNVSNTGNNAPINNNVSKIGNGAPINNNVINTGNNAPINNNVSKIGNGATINNNVSKIGNGAPINNNVSKIGSNAPINNNVSKIGNSAPINNNASKSGNSAPINNNVRKIGNGAPINNNVGNTGNNAPINNNVSKIGNSAPINNNVSKIRNSAPINNNASKSGNNAPINNNVSNTGNNAPINNNVSKIGNYVSRSTSIWDSGTNNKCVDDLRDPDGQLPEKLRNVTPRHIELVSNEIMIKNPNVHWDDIAGLTHAKKCVNEMAVYPLRRPDLFMGCRSPGKGLLLFGPPGTGKTMIGKAIAGEAKATFFYISSSSLTSRWYGEGEKLVRALFGVASCRQPAVIFVDEIDSLLSQRMSNGNEHEATRRIKTQFLIEMEGFDGGDEQVLVIGATNRPQDLDEAARRRLTKRLYITLPSSDARAWIVRNLLEKDGLFKISNEEMEIICNLTEGYSGSDMKNLVKDASMGPLREAMEQGKDIMELKKEDMRPVTLQDFKNSLQEIKPSVSPNELGTFEQWNKQFGTLAI